MTTVYDAVPAELRDRDQWVVWRLEERDGKATKVPYVPGGTTRASTTNPTTWRAFEEAVAGAAVADGVGYVFAADDPYVGIDLDTLDADAGAILLALDSYTEKSVSGRGAHVIVRASLNGHPRNRKGPLEVYDVGRYFVVTGAHVAGTPTTIEERQEQLERVLAEFLPTPIVEQRDRRPAVLVDVDDRELLDRALAARNGAAFERLWNGDTGAHGGDDSAADLALCAHLAFWTGRDPERIDRLFRTSGLMRAKWNRDDYRTRTINAAIAGCDDVYTPPRPRPSTSSRPRPKVTSSLVPTPYGGDEDEHLVPDLVPAPDEEPHSWLPLDLVAAAASPPAPPDIIGLFYRGYNHLVSGESEALKTWLLLAAAVDELRAGRGVLWIDGDDVGQGAVLERLRLLGADDDAIATSFAYIVPDEPIRDRMTGLLEIVAARSCRLAVLDGFNPLLGLHELDPDRGVDVEKFFRLIDPIRKMGVATVLTDNVVKSKEARGGWAIGSERKRSKPEVHLGMARIVPLVRGGTGRAKIDVHKDRPGHLERPSPGLLVVTSTTTTCSWEIKPDDSRDEQGEFRPTALMSKVSHFLERRQEPASRNEIEKAGLGKAGYVRVAIDRLVEEGYASEFGGKRGARLVRLDRAFVDDGEASE